MVTLLAIIGAIVLIFFIVAGVSGINQYKKMEDESAKASREFYSKLHEVADTMISSDDASSLASRFYELNLSRLLLDYRDVNLYEEVRKRMASTQANARMMSMVIDLSSSIMASTYDRRLSYTEWEAMFDALKQSCIEILKDFIRDLGISVS